MPFHRYRKEYPAAILDLIYKVSTVKGTDERSKTEHTECPDALYITVPSGNLRAGVVFAGLSSAATPLR